MVLDNPEISPWHLLKQYVSLTSSVTSGTLVLRALYPPFKSLSSERIASLTKDLLKKFGIPVEFWGAHSTRGAAVQFYKKLGFSTEAVCHIGQWKNEQAFRHHYLRVGAHEEAKLKLSKIVHNVSQGFWAEHEGSHTPQTKERGGRDPECEAQKQ